MSTLSLVCAAILMMQAPVDVSPVQVARGASIVLDLATRTRLLETVWVAYAPTNYDPGANPPIYPSEQSIRDDLRTLRTAGFDGLVTYGTDVPEIPRIADEVGFSSLLLGVWTPGDRAEMQRAKQTARLSIVLGLIAGNEGLADHRYSLSVLRQAMEELRAETRKPVSTTEVIESYFTKPELVEWSDFLAVNAHPYAHQIRDPIAAAGWTAQVYANLASRSGGKALIFKESGLPTRAPGLTEKAQYAYYSALKDTTVKFVFFEAFDALFKRGSVEQSWGLFHADRTPKPAAMLARPAASVPEQKGVRTW